MMTEFFKATEIFWSIRKNKTIGLEDKIQVSPYDYGCFRKTAKQTASELQNN